MKTRIYSSIKPILILMTALLMGMGLTAQEKASPKFRLSYIKHMNGTYEIRAHAFVKRGKEIEHCTGINFGFYTDADYEKLFRKIPSDDMGMATLKLTGAEANTFKDSTGHYHIYGRIEKNEKYKSQEADVSAMDADIDVNFKQESDTEKVLLVALNVYDEKSGKMIPGVKLPVKSAVKRSLCSLPVGEENNYTDSTGKVAIVFPNDIPGDADGTITVIVKLEDDDNYGTVMFEKNVKWGQRLVAAESPIDKRSLIGARNNAPWFMVVIINAILISIWGYLLYVVYGLYRIRKLGNRNG